MARGIVRKFMSTHAFSLRPGKDTAYRPDCSRFSCADQRGFYLLELYSLCVFTRKYTDTHSHWNLYICARIIGANETNEIRWTVDWIISALKMKVVWRHDICQPSRSMRCWCAEYRQVRTPLRVFHPILPRHYFLSLIFVYVSLYTCLCTYHHMYKTRLTRLYTNI